MKDVNVFDWYIEFCLKIKYMFLWVYVVVYILMVLWVVYFKVYFLLIYYMVYFLVCVDDFDLVVMVYGKDVVKVLMKVIIDKGMDVSVKEKNLLIVLELVNEMLEWGFKFFMVDFDKFDVLDWLIDGDMLIVLF